MYPEPELVPCTKEYVEENCTPCSWAWGDPKDMTVMCKLFGWKVKVEK